jgi:HlyD family secretion protein
MDGVVSLLNVKKGERVVGTAQMAGTEMMRIADMRRIEIRVDVTENDIAKVNIGDSAVITVDAYINRKFKGVVYQVASSQTGAVNASASASSTSSEVTNYKVFITLLHESYADLLDPKFPNRFPFKPGMTANADIQTITRQNVISVPLNAVTTRDKNEGKEGEEKKEKKTDMNRPATDEEEDNKEVVVFVYDAQKLWVTKKKVKTGIQDTRYIEILEGLKPGEQVVSEPYNAISRTLKDETKVLVVDKEKLFEVKK